MPQARLYLVDGTSGVWKEDLVSYIDHTLVDATIVHKLTTRAPRIGEDFGGLDLTHIDDAIMETVASDYEYEYAGSRYGVQSAAIRKARKSHRHVFVIVRNVDLLRRIRRDFARFSPPTVFIYADPLVLPSRLGARSTPAAQDAARQAFDDYLRSPADYDELIVNAASTNDFCRLLDLLMTRGGNRPPYWDTDRKLPRVLIYTSARSRNATRVTLGAASAAAISFIISVIAAGDYSSGRTVAVAAVGLLLLAVLLIEVLLSWAWQDVDARGAKE